MKIIITKKFKKELQNFRVYFDLYEFINDLKKQNKSFLHIHDDFFKFKSKLNFVQFRGVVVLARKEGDIIPLFIALKKDKQYGENIIWENYNKFIEKKFIMTLEELKKGDYEKY